MGNLCSNAPADLNQAEFAQQQFELMYWPITALGEPIRLAMAIGGIPLKDTTPKTDPSFMDRKTAFGTQVPILVVDGKPMDQSRSILRYVGKICKYQGKPLYPEDAMEAFWCDNLIDLTEDMRSPIGATFAIQDQKEKEAARAALFTADGGITKFLKVLDDKIQSRIGQSPTIGDIYCFCVTNIFRQPTFIDGIPAGALDEYKNLTAFHTQIANFPPILEYYKDAVEIRTTAKPVSTTLPSQTPEGAKMLKAQQIKPTSPEYELLYWPITGLGEPIRMAMTMGGLPFKDTTPKTDEKFMDRKQAIGAQVPILLVDGTPMDQSRSILRYIGKICKYDGKPLYPTDPIEAFWCDNLIDLTEDMRSPIGKTFAIQDQTEKEAARAALFAADGGITKFLKKLDEKIISRIGQSPTIGDIYVFCCTNLFRQPTFIDGIPAGNLDQYENLTKFHAQMSRYPPVLEYYKDAVEPRTTFKPRS